MNLFEFFTDKPLDENAEEREREQQAEEELAPVRRALEEPDVFTFGEDFGFKNPRRLVGFACMLVGVIFIIQYPFIQYPSGNYSGGFFFGGGFFVYGYCYVFYFPDRLDIDLQRRRWVHRPGSVRPFTRATEGSLDEWEQVRFAQEQRTLGDVADIDFWCVSLIARAGNGAPSMLEAFYFQCAFVSREAALVLAQRLARKLDLPLREEDEAQGEQRQPQRL